MHVLFDAGHENGFSKGLQLINGTIRHISSLTGYNHQLPLPHIGWNQIDTYITEKPPDNSASSPYVYFSHSYALSGVIDPSIITSTTNYSGATIISSVRQNNLIGFQFHPERSAHFGITLLRNAICELTNYS